MNITMSDKLLYFGAGCGIGLIVGTLFAPRSGQEMRENLGSKMDDLSHKVQDTIHSSGETASQTWQNVVEKGKNVAAVGRRRFNESVESGKRRFSEALEAIDEDDISQR